jgi:hypothetical protein
MEVTNEAVKNAVKELFGKHEIKETSTGITIWMEEKDDHYMYFRSITIWTNLTFDGPEKFKIFGSYSKFSRSNASKVESRNFSHQRSGDAKKTIARLKTLASINA